MRTTSTLVLFSLAFTHTSTAHADSFGSGANQFDIEFVTIGDANNPDDTTGNPNPAGSVAYAYRIGKFEVSEDMINKANALDGLGLDHDNRGPDKPATSMSWLEAARFVNWLNTSTGHTPAYKFDLEPGDPGYNKFQTNLLWTPGDAGYNPANPFRNSLARYFLPSFDEWYKAAYYDPNTGVYYDFPTGSDAIPDGIDFAGDPTFDAVFRDGVDSPQVRDVTDVGLLSPYGTAGQGGSAFEWEESESDLINDTPLADRGFRGGDWSNTYDLLRSNSRIGLDPQTVDSGIGFRVASIIPEPGALALISLAAVGLFATRRRSPQPVTGLRLVARA